MIIHNFYVLGGVISPLKAYSVFVVDPNAVLPLPVALEFLKSIPRQRRQIEQGLRSVESRQFYPTLCMQIYRQCPPRQFGVPAVIYIFSSLRKERPNRHLLVIPYTGNKGNTRSVVQVGYLWA